jgi:hypothetical protein
VAGRPVPALHAGKDGTHRLPADLGRELFDRCQRDLLEARNGGVVARVASLVNHRKAW